MVSRETRARDEIPAVAERRPGTTGPDNRFGRKRPARCHGPAASALEERRPRHSLFSFKVEEQTSVSRGGEAEPMRPGRVGRWEARRRRRLRPKLTRFSPADGDRQIADCSAGTLRHCRITSVRLSASICVICGFLRWVGGLCVFVSSCLRCSVFFSVSLCLCGSTPQRAGTKMGSGGA